MLRFFMSFSIELEEADCLELWCLKQPGYFLSSDCSLLMFKHKASTRLMDVNGCPAQEGTLLYAMALCDWF